VLGEHLTYAFDDPQAVRFLAGIAEVCAERGYGLLIVPTGTGDQDRDSFLGSGLDPDTVAYPVTRDRLAGYRDAAHDLGIDWAQVPVAVCRTNDEADARALMRQVLAAAPDVDAVAAMNDPMALAVLSEASGPLRVSGWDDSDLARQHGLTTVAQSLREQGAACATAALGDPAPDQRDAWRVVRRASTGS
jgi:DNA-binding LacI/PurR family transcriptional regulator